MGTRGFLGIRNNKKLLSGRYNGMDSYYDQLGKEVIDCYFRGGGRTIINFGDGDDMNFLQDGLFCEYSYIYNKENDTLEIYRGFFKKKQHLNSDTKIKIIDALEEKNGNEYYCHLIMIIDRKEHTKEQVLKAFEEYNTYDDDEGTKPYPERKVIPLKINKDFIPLT
jgi:hypothetical protein